mmetsp:Transcript_20103/g.32723  ORF Transcript_20103/g.32723 Transcript_20103/m.32723 type:complete len:95 (-) Transcript_20103:194-478(-)
MQQFIHQFFFSRSHVFHLSSETSLDHMFQHVKSNMVQDVDILVVFMKLDRPILSSSSSMPPILSNTERKNSRWTQTCLRCSILRGHTELGLCER